MIVEPILLAYPWAAPFYLAWVSFAPGAWATLAGGGALVAIAVMGLRWLPPIIRRPVMLAGIALIAAAAIWQAAVAEGVRRADQHAHELAIRAETERADRSDKIAAAIAAQATQDLAAAQADNAQLRKLTDETQKRPDAGRVVLPRDLARRLRAL